ncbi:unnamed protein product, partial [Phaeothamnion confervicola]
MMLFNARGDYIETCGFGSPTSSDRAVTHMGDAVRGTGARINEQLELRLDLVHKRVFFIILLCTCYSGGSFAGADVLRLRLVGKRRHFGEASGQVLEREVARTVVTHEGILQPREGCLTVAKPTALIIGDIRKGGKEERDAAAAGCGWVYRTGVLQGRFEAGADSTLVMLAQTYLQRWVPGLVFQGEELVIRRVYDIVHHLTPAAMDTLQRRFVDGRGSLDRDGFFRAMLAGLLQHPQLRPERQCVQLLCMLSDLWSQISAPDESEGGVGGHASSSSSHGTARRSGGSDGDRGTHIFERVKWEELTAFWVEAGMISTQVRLSKCWADEALQYRASPRFALQARRPTAVVTRPSFNRLVVLEERGSSVRIVDGASGALTQTLCPDTYQLGELDGRAPESFLTVMCVELMESRGWVAVASSDYSIGL